MTRTQTKRRSQRRDYERRRNINRQRPSEEYEIEKPIRQVVIDKDTGKKVKDENGTPLTTVVGYRKVKKRRKKGAFRQIEYPKSRKFTPSKKNKKPETDKDTQKEEKAPETKPQPATEEPKRLYNPRLCKTCQAKQRRNGSAYCEECAKKYKESKK